MLLTLLTAVIFAPTTWYGPGSVTFNVQFPGNPYDPSQNDLRVRFTDEHHNTIERLAYFDGQAWRAQLVAPAPGKYKSVLVRNGKPSTEEATPAVLLITQKLPHGFLHADPTSTNRFAFDDGTRYFPIGFNLAWHNKDMPAMTDEMAKVAANGLTWTRIWSAAWDKKNPWWPTGDTHPLRDQLWQPALTSLQTLLGAASESRLNVQLVLFYHGAFSTSVDSNWADNPWNVAKGGFLKNPADFFTDPEAKRRAKMWLRYAVARYGSSPSLMAWELFNEFEWTDAAHEGRFAEIAAWHTEMAEYIRSIDPYHHLITTSSNLTHPEIYASLDCYQPHLYDTNLPAKLLTNQTPGDKPSFLGEFGSSIDNPKQSDEKMFIREVLWSSLLKNEAGAAMYWFWDRVETLGLFPEFKSWATVVSDGDVASHPLAKRGEVLTDAGKADGLRDNGWIIIRLRGAKGKTVHLKWPGITDGSWHLKTVDLDTGAMADSRMQVQNGEAKPSSLDSDDAVLIASNAG